MKIITEAVSRKKSAQNGRFSACFAMPSGTASEVRQAISEATFQKLLEGLRRRKFVREPEG